MVRDMRTRDQIYVGATWRGSKKQMDATNATGHDHQIELQHHPKAESNHRHHLPNQHRQRQTLQALQLVPLK